MQITRDGSVRAAAIWVSIVSAVGSLWLLLRAGRTTPRGLLVLMALWALSPFVLFAALDVMSKRWKQRPRALYVVMMVIAVASVAAYALTVFGFPQRRPAPVFVMVPPVSWLLILLAVATSASITRKQARPAA
jgi:hypothetical protein